MNKLSFWLACFLSLSFHSACLALIWMVQYLLPASPPFILLPYGDADVEGMSVSALAVDSGSMYQAHEDRPGGEVIRGPLNRTPAPLAVPETAPATEPQPAAVVFSATDAAELAKSESANDEPAEAPELPPTIIPLPTLQPEKSVAPEPPAVPTPLPESVAPQPALVARAAAEAARGLTAPNGLGKNAAESPGVGKAAGAQGSSRMAPGTPSAGGKVGYTNGVSVVSYPRPYYPPEARNAGLQGTVLVWLRVSTDGSVLEARVERSSGHTILDDAAVRFAYTVRLHPARQGAIPVVAEAKLPVAYRLLD